MHILLTDVLTCPRCGPDVGLVLLADRLEARRVIEGSLGCPGCRRQYPIRSGTADLRVPGAGTPRRVDPQVLEAAEEEALRLAALLGVTEGGGILLVAGKMAGLAGGVAARLEGVEVVAVGSAREDDGAAGRAVSRILVPDRLPFASRSLRGVALEGAGAGTLLEEGVRVLAPMHRLVLQGAGTGARARVEDLGLEVLAEQDEILVALKREAPDPPRLYQLV